MEVNLDVTFTDCRCIGFVDNCLYIDFDDSKLANMAIARLQLSIVGIAYRSFSFGSRPWISD